MKRLALDKLFTWKSRENRRPLILRGARQVGKTWLVREFGKSFECFIEVNFEETPEVGKVFEQDLKIDRIVRDLGLLMNRSIDLKKTLIFFDEVQECPNALKALRYFYENFPDANVVAAGSLIDFVLNETGIPVGRVEFLHIYPLSFIEFLLAFNESPLVDFLLHGIREPLNDAIHQKLLRYFSEYMAVGGMPDAVSSWIEHRELFEVEHILSILAESYREDFYKYAKKNQIKYLTALLQNIPLNIGKKIIYSKIIEQKRSREIIPAMDLLLKAKVAHLIYHTKGNGVPIEAEKSDSIFKPILMDIAFTQRLLGLRLTDWVLDFDSVLANRGSIIEAFVGQEIMANLPSNTKSNLYYWVREEKNAMAEVDYLIERNNQIIPIEVKAGKLRHSKSLHVFLQEKRNSPYGIIFSSANYSISHQGKIINLPIYAVASIFADGPSMTV